MPSEQGEQRGGLLVPTGQQPSQGPFLLQQEAGFKQEVLWWHLSEPVLPEDFSKDPPSAEEKALVALRLTQLRPVKLLLQFEPGLVRRAFTPW